MNAYRKNFKEEDRLPVRTWGEWLVEALLWLSVPGGLVLLFMACLACASCNNTALQVQARTADAIAAAANVTLPMMVERYRAEGVKVIEAAKTEEEARAGLDAVKAKWKPFWLAWDVLQQAHLAWVGSLESGGDVPATLGAIKTAYCALLKNWPGDVPVVPLAPVVCAGATP